MRLRVPAGEPGVPYTVRVDGGPPLILIVRPEGERYQVATGLKPGAVARDLRGFAPPDEEGGAVLDSPRCRAGFLALSRACRCSCCLRVW